MLDKPKVLIAGGSIAGLSLALMLEKNGIDFLVLEGYSDIAPQVGASIGVLPSGLRILDQLGCADDVLAMAEYHVQKVRLSDSNAKPFWSMDDFGEKIVKRHGYPVVFFDRRMLIQILYDHIQQKDKILTSQRVVSIENHPWHVSVTTKTGEKFTGSMLVGGDGIHSTVRQEMWKEAQKEDPEWFDPNEEAALPVTYACIFGISEGVPIEKGTMTSICHENFSFLVPSGPGDRTYWFLVRNLGKTVYGSEIPCFTKEEELAFAKEHFDNTISSKVKFSDLWEKKITSVYTTLPEYVYKKWHYKRTMTIGDAAHKFEPLTGQGGNSAIETSAALANHLVAAINLHPSFELSTDEISSVFAKTQAQREDRAWTLVRDSHSRQRLECLETPIHRFIAKKVMPHIPQFLFLNRWIGTYSPAISLNMLPIPHKPHEIPYYDELLHAPSSRGRLAYLVYILFAVMAFAARKMLFGAWQVNGTLSLLGNVLLSGSIDQGVDLRQVYTGYPVLDKILKTLVAIFSPAISNPSNPEQPLQLLWFLSSVLPLVCVITVEGYRSQNQWTPIASAGFWGILYQLRGIGFIAPIYFAFFFFVSGGATFFIRSGKDVSSARFILPALILGFGIPTILLFLPWGDSNTQQAVIAAWQPAPLVVSVLVTVFSTVDKVFSRALDVKENATTGHDMPHLSFLYKATGLIAASFHLSFVLACAISKSFSLTRILVPSSIFQPVDSLAEGVWIFFQNDFLLVATASSVFCLLSIWDLNRSGFSGLDIRACFCGMVVGYVILGPGATLAAVWLWREEAMRRVPGVPTVRSGEKSK